MPVETGQRARWAAMNADPERKRQIAAASAQRERERAQLHQAAVAAASRPVALATATAAVQRPGMILGDAGGAARIDLLDEISAWWGIGAADFAAALAEVPDGDLILGISSPGGDVFEATAILNMLRKRPGQLTVIVEGIAASAASMIAMAASPGRLFMSQNSLMMIHDAFCNLTGPEQEHRDVADLLGRESDNLAAIYAARTGQPASVMREAMRAESWYIGQEAVDAGLADAVLDASGKPDPWASLGAKLAGPEKAPGRPGNPALRQHAYNRHLAQTGRPQGRVSPFIAAVFRL